MKATNQVALAALQILSVSGGLTQAIDSHAVAAAPKAETQTMVNQLSLASIEKSWLMIPQMCKAAGFNAQPEPMQFSQRSQAAQALYATFAS